MGFWTVCSSSRSSRRNSGCSLATGTPWYPSSCSKETQTLCAAIAGSLCCINSTHVVCHCQQQTLRILISAVHAVAKGLNIRVCCLALLCAALQSGGIKGAGLDVFAVEPLSEDSPLWTLPNVYLTPHSTARTTRFMHDNVDLFLENLQRYIAGQELLNGVDKSLGY